MKEGDYVYIKGPRGSYAGNFAGEIGEVIEIVRNVYPDNEPDQQDLIRVGIAASAATRIPLLAKQSSEFWRLNNYKYLKLPGDTRFGLNFFPSELEDFPESPVVG
jgi:hypothetical protein